MGPSFFGLPKNDDPEFSKLLAIRQINLLRELRYIAKEIGLSEARRMPVEVRQWWIEEINRDREREQANSDAEHGRKTVDVK